MKVKCEKHPELHVHDLKVRFRKGVAEVTKAQFDKLKAMPGLSFEELKEPLAAPAAPADPQASTTPAAATSAPAANAATPQTNGGA